MKFQASHACIRIEAVMAVILRRKLFSETTQSIFLSNQNGLIHLFQEKSHMPISKNALMLYML